ncbi:hypothetical protein [Deinococcus sp. QL22]|uniref:hypothetical protein n=1 Tax=Deinococcus sp. QL22 TaxID=2939437 RepID=UPI00201774E6|nr:hypothetical protein [Deinococcus sp. QL22]UQN08770.1 hypothetical protein M1R55_21890 [Deinococcus sp. QL22]
MDVPISRLEALARPHAPLKLQSISNAILAVTLAAGARLSDSLSLSGMFEVPLTGEGLAAFWTESGSGHKCAVLRPLLLWTSELNAAAWAQIRRPTGTQ